MNTYEKEDWLKNYGVLSFTSIDGSEKRALFSPWHGKQYTVGADSRSLCIEKMFNYIQDELFRMTNNRSYSRWLM